MIYLFIRGIFIEYLHVSGWGNSSSKDLFSPDAYVVVGVESGVNKEETGTAEGGGLWRAHRKGVTVWLGGRTGDLDTGIREGFLGEVRFMWQMAGILRILSVNCIYPCAPTWSQPMFSPAGLLSLLSPSSPSHTQRWPLSWSCLTHPGFVFLHNAY